MYLIPTYINIIIMREITTINSLNIIFEGHYTKINNGKFKNSINLISRLCIIIILSYICIYLIFEQQDDEQQQQSYNVISYYYMVYEIY